MTTSTLCDALIMSDGASLHTPFAALGVPAEGCSSVHFARIAGADNASRMLDDGWKPTAAEAVSAGLAHSAVRGGELLEAAHERAHELARGGGGRWFEDEARGGEAGLLDRCDRARRRAAATLRSRTHAHDACPRRYRAVNAQESLCLADSIFTEAFLTAQLKFAESRGKEKLASTFRTLLKTRWAWSRLLPSTTPLVPRA